MNIFSVIFIVVVGLFSISSSATSFHDSSSSVAGLPLGGVATDKANINVFSTIDVIAYSEPVSIENMVNGWDDSFRRGDIAYADADARVGFFYQPFNMYFARSWRRYYYMEFHPETAERYFAIEQNQDRQQEDKLELDVQLFESQGFNVGFLFDDLNNGQMEFLIEGYYHRIDHYQVGRIDGRSAGGASNDATAIIDYFYDQDKLFDHEPDAKSGLAYGLSAGISGDIRQNIQYRLMVDDVFNRRRFDRAGFTEGCFNIGEIRDPVCESRTTAEGRSGNDAYQLSIQPAIQLAVAYSSQHRRFFSGKAFQLSLSGYQRDRFKQYDLGYQIQMFKPTALSVNLNSLGGFGVGFSHRYVSVSVAADALAEKDIRSLNLSTQIRIPLF